MTSEPNVNTENGLANTSLALGIASIGTMILLFVNLAPNHGNPTDFSGLQIIGGVMSLFALAAIITGTISLNQIKKQGGPGKNPALAGILLGIAAPNFLQILILLLPSIYFIWVLICLITGGGKGI